jgi:hypothetical protein
MQWELRFLEGHDGGEYTAHQDVIAIITNTMMTLIFMTFTYSRSDIKIMKLIMLENNTNNLNGNLIQQNINCHSQCDDKSIIITAWVLEPKKSFSKKTHKDIKLIHKSHCLLQKRVFQWLEN